MTVAKWYDGRADLLLVVDAVHVEFHQRIFEVPILGMGYHNLRGKPIRPRWSWSCHAESNAVRGHGPRVLIARAPTRRPTVATRRGVGEVYLETAGGGPMSMLRGSVVVCVCVGYEGSMSRRHMTVAKNANVRFVNVLDCKLRAEICFES